MFDGSIFPDELRAQNYSMQAGFNAYAQAVKYHSLTLARVETEVEGLKQAKTENDVVTGELQQANTVKGLRIDELETKMNKLLEGKGTIAFKNISCDSMWK